MSPERLVALIGLSILGALALCLPVRAVDFRSNLLLLGQVRDGDQSHQTETPTDLYGELGADRIHHDVGAETYFRLERDFARAQDATDLYAASMHGAIKGVDFSLGRQFLNEVPGGVFVADGGRVRFDPGGPVAFSVFGGQPYYFEPTSGTASVSQDEQIFGGSVHTTRLRSGFLSLGFLQQDRDQRTLRQLVSGTGTYSFAHVPGQPSLYSTVGLDVKRQNIDFANAGTQIFLSQPRLLLNLESGYYKPQNQGERLVTDINRREDPIFELFSLSQMVQLRGGVRYLLTHAVSAYGDYSYQHYEKLTGQYENGQVGSVGLLWLPGGDGLERVQIEYYGADSTGGNVNGGRLSYESLVYDRIVFRTKLDVSYYEKESNQSDTAVSGRVGVGYVVLPGLLAEVNFEGNRNMRFNEDFRFGFFLTYNLRYRPGQSVQQSDPTLQRLPGGAPS